MASIEQEEQARLCAEEEDETEKEEQRLDRKEAEPESCAAADCPQRASGNNV